MKLSTRSLYGTRMMLDLAQNYGKGPITVGDIATREDIPLNYLQQLVTPLKQANLIKTIRGCKGGNVLAKPPREITVGEIVRTLENGIDLALCIRNPNVCKRSSHCLTRGVWEQATKAMQDRLNAISLSELIENRNGVKNPRGKVK